jgi:hypothetical protein
MKRSIHPSVDRVPRDAYLYWGAGRIRRGVATSRLGLLLNIGEGLDHPFSARSACTSRI